MQLHRFNQNHPKRATGTDGRFFAGLIVVVTLWSFVSLRNLLVKVDVVKLRATSEVEAGNLGLEDKLKVRSPKLPDGAPSKGSVVGLIHLGLRPDDLAPLMSAKSISSCRTSSNHNAHDSKNFSNFGAECFRSQSESQYLRSDVTLRNESRSRLRAQYSWNSTQKNEIIQPVQQRIIMRSAQALVAEHPAISDLLSGKIQLQIAPDAWWDAFSRPTTQEQRPTYVVVEEVNNPDYGGPQLVASLGNSHSSQFIRPRIQRKLVEELPPAQQPTSESTSMDIENSASLEVKPEGFRQNTARTLGLTTKPFGKFDLRLQRGGQPGAEDLGLRISEGNGLIYAEKPGLAKQSDWMWGWKLPYGSHFIGFHYPNSKSSALRTYGYVIDSANQLTLAYNPNDLSYLLSLRTNL